MAYILLVFGVAGVACFFLLKKMKARGLFLAGGIILIILAIIILVSQSVSSYKQQEAASITAQKELYAVQNPGAAAAASAAIQEAIQKCLNKCYSMYPPGPKRRRCMGGCESMAF